MASAFTIFGEINVDTGDLKGSLRQIDRELKKTAKGLNRVEKEAKDAGKTNNRTARSFEKIKDKTKEVSKNLDKATDSYRKGTSTTKQYESALKRAARATTSLSNRVKDSSARIADASARMKTATKHTRSFTQRMGLSVLSANLATNAISSLANQMSNGARAIVSYSSEIEQARIGFETLTGSTQKANKHLEDLKAFAQKTPFDFSGLTKTSQLLQGVGIDSKRIIPLMTAVGNSLAAAGKGQENLQRVALAMSQIESKGKLAGQEVNQLAENGIPAWKLLSEELGKSKEELIEMGRKGQITSKIFFDAMESFAEKNFAGAMEKQSHTFQGSIERIKESLLNLSSGAGANIFKGISKALDEAANKLQEAKNLQEAGQAIGHQLGKSIGEGLKNSLRGINLSDAIGTENIAGKLFKSLGAGLADGLLGGNDLDTAILKAINNLSNSVVNGLISMAEKVLRFSNSFSSYISESIAGWFGFEDVVKRNSANTDKAISETISGWRESIDSNLASNISEINKNQIEAWRSVGESAVKGLKSADPAIQAQSQATIDRLSENLLSALKNSDLSASAESEVKKMFNSLPVKGEKVGNKTGTALSTAFADTIKKASPSAIASQSNLVKPQTAQAVKSGNTLGKTLSSVTATSIASNTTAALMAQKKLIEPNTADASGKGRSVGSSFGGGVVIGVNSWVGRAVNAAANIIHKMFFSAQSAQDSHSPSKRAAKDIGKPFVQGIGVGIEQARPGLESIVNNLIDSSFGSAMRSIEDTAKTAFNTLTNSINKLSKVKPPKIAEKLGELKDIFQELSIIKPPSIFDNLERLFKDKSLATYIDATAKSLGVTTERLKEFIRQANPLVQIANATRLGVASADNLPQGRDASGLGDIGNGLPGGNVPGRVQAPIGEPPPPPVVDAWTNFLDTINHRIKEAQDSFGRMSTFLATTLTDSLYGIGDVLGDAFANFNGSFKDFFSSIAQGFKSLVSDIISQLIRMLAYKAIFGLIGSFAGGGGIGGIFGNLFGGGSSGGVGAGIGSNINAGFGNALTSGAGTSANFGGGGNFTSFMPSGGFGSTTTTNNNNSFAPTINMQGSGNAEQDRRTATMVAREVTQAMERERRRNR